MTPPAVSGTPPQLRRFGAVNWVGVWTLYRREVRRFFKVYMQTVAAPVVSTLLFLAIIMLASGGARQIAGMPYIEFLAPGLIMMAMMQNAFANTSSSIMLGKVQGNIVDILTPPLSAAELTLGMALGGVTRGVLVGLIAALTLMPFVSLQPAAPAAAAFHAVAASLLMSLLGLIGGLWAEKFDHIATVTNFVVMPLTFLSGTFYSVEQLPPLWQQVAHADPFFYMIDGFRYGFTGRAEGSLLWGAVAIAGLDLALLVLCHRLIASGYKLKS